MEPLGSMKVKTYKNSNARAQMWQDNILAVKQRPNLSCTKNGTALPKTVSPSQRMTLKQQIKIQQQKIERMHIKSLENQRIKPNCEIIQGPSPTKALGSQHGSTTAYSAFPPPRQRKDLKDFVKTNKYSSQNASVIHSVDSTRAKNRVQEQDEVVSSYQDHCVVDETVNYGLNQRNSVSS